MDPVGHLQLLLYLNLQLLSTHQRLQLDFRNKNMLTVLMTLDTDVTGEVQKGLGNTLTLKRDSFPTHHILIKDMINHALFQAVLDLNIPLYIFQLQELIKKSNKLLPKVQLWLLLVRMILPERIHLIIIREVYLMGHAQLRLIMQ